MNNNFKKVDSISELKTIQFQTIDMCNRSCNFCPNKYDLRKTGTPMAESVIFRILDCLKEMKFRGRISPYLMNEPLLDPRLPTLIQTIRRDFPTNIIFMNSNGDAIHSQSLRERLAESGLDAMQLNCYDGEEEFKEKTEVVERWAEADSRILVHYSGSLRKMYERNGQLNIRVKCISKPLPAFWNRAGHIPSLIPSGVYRGLRTCSLPFEQMYINYLGQAVLCCCDYRFEVVLGSVVDTSLAALWKGHVYQQYRTCHEKSNLDSLLLCRTCNRTIATK